MEGIIRSRWCWALVVALSTAGAFAARAAEPTAEQLDFFEKRVRPVFVARCAECHSGAAAESDFDVETLAGLLRGGRRGPALVPGEPDKSLLILAVNHADQLHMPPKSKLPTQEIADLTEWVKMGAPWPHAAPDEIRRPAEAGGPLFTPEQRSFWAFQRPVPSPRPVVNDPDWMQSPIDGWILARLQAAGLKPAPPADRRTLIRRATFDLTGLPPTVEEVDAFLADPSPNAFAKVIDRLLESPRYGERWGRHWLDVVRYADSNGLDENLAYASAFRYRDYVIAARNRDKPYDRFLLEQVAGDLLPEDDSTPLPERLTATGFLCLGAKMLAEDDPVKMQLDIIDEQIDTLGRAVLGLTLGCARCHDHKFDPVPMADYYSLAGVFKSTKTMENFRVVARWQERPVATAAELQAFESQRAQITDKQVQVEKVRSAAVERLLDQARQHVGDYLLAAHRHSQWDAARKQAVVHGKQLDTMAPPGGILLEAEDYARGNVLKDRDQYGQGIGVLVNAGQVPNFVEYDVTAAGGIYQLELRYAAASARPCRLYINGQLVAREVAALATGSWHPDGQQWAVEGFFALQPGTNTIRLEHPQFFPHIDKLLLVPEPAGASYLLLEQEFVPVAEWVQQWAEYLVKAEGESGAVFAPWKQAVAENGLGTWEGFSPELCAALNLSGEPLAVPDLARRYQERGAHVVAEWNRLRQQPGPAVERLENAIDERLRQVLFDPKGPFAVPEAVETYFAPDEAAQLAALRQEQKSLEQSLPKLPETMAVAEDRPENLRIHLRGSHLTLGEEVPRRFPRILAGEQQTAIGSDRSGRLELARWLADPQNPLTARVMVNRIWQGHFGEALVRSPDNFGTLGERPTHPELLDVLAVDFVKQGFSIKAMHRLIMLSATYQMSSQWNEQAAAVDPENRLWWRMNRRRLDAEEVRDAILAVTGGLDLTMGGSMLPTRNREYVTSTANVDPVAYKSNRRSVYLPVVRSALYDVFQAFDFPDPSVPNGKRQSTTIAQQALFMLNSESVAEPCGHWAKELLARGNLDDQARLAQLFRTALGRLPSAAEASQALEFVSQYAAAYEASGGPASDSRWRAWQSLCRAVLARNEFIYVD